MEITDLVRLANRGMIAFDLALGTAAIAAPDATLRRMGHDRRRWTRAISSAAAGRSG